MRSVNLYHLYTSAKIRIAEYRSYDKILSNRLKISNLGEREKGSLYYLVDHLLKKNCNIAKLENFYYSYIIPHIGKEFDLLKLDSKAILNIELKSQHVGLDRIKAQLLNNKKYLKYLNKEMYLFTFISDIKEFYCLNEDDELVLCDVSKVLDIMNLFNEEELDIDKLFKAGDYLVSPTTNPNKFLNGQYFLTTQQEFIKNNILNSLKNNSYFKITGDAGTGKTLLLFDIAKELKSRGKVFVILCNKLQESHKKIAKSLNIFIIDQKQLDNNLSNLIESDYILVDEAQRMSEKIWSKLQLNKKKIIFSVDNKQFLTKEEEKLNISSLIDKLNPVKYKLSNKIRINNNISNFTYRLFDLSLSKYPFNFSNVEVVLANNENELTTYINMYSKNFIYIDILNLNYDFPNRVKIDDVLGNDYENVLIIIDEKFYYKGSKLGAQNSNENDYLYLKLLYQGLSRTREKLVLVIYKNKSLFTRIINEGAKYSTY